MDETPPRRVQQIGWAASRAECERTGRKPESVAVVLGGETLVVTLYGALSPAEQALARTPAGASHVQELYRLLFESAWDPLRREIERLTGATVREATADVHGASGIVVQVFLLAGTLPAETWSGTAAVG